jgi:lipase
MTDATPIPLHVDTYGASAGDPILAVHGITGFGARFERLAGMVPERRWLCPDLRGHGASPAHAPWRTEDHVVDLVAVLDAHDVERADVVGHSFGGHLALHLLAAAPDRVGKVVLLDPASMIDPARAEQGALDHARDPGWASEDEARAEIATWFPGEGSEPDLGPEIERNLGRDAEGRWRMRYSPVVIVAAYGEMARPLPDLPDHDVLLVEADPEHSTVNDALRAHLARCLGEDAVGREIVAGAHHVLFRTHLEDTAAAIGPYLSA